MTTTTDPYHTIDDVTFMPAITLSKRDRVWMVEADWGGSIVDDTYDDGPGSPAQTAADRLDRTLEAIRARLNMFDETNAPFTHQALARELVRMMRPFFELGTNEFEELAIAALRAA